MVYEDAVLYQHTEIKIIGDVPRLERVGNQ